MIELKTIEALASEALDLSATELERQLAQHPQGGALLGEVAAEYHELRTLKDLMGKIAEKERGLRGVNIVSALATHRFGDRLQYDQSQVLRFLNEIRTRAYGRAVYLRRVGDGELRSWRIAQANYGFPEVGVINRLSRVAQMLASVDVGDDVRLPNGDECEVLGIAHFERHMGNELLHNYQNFRSMDLAASELDFIASDLAATFSIRLDELKALLKGESLPERPTAVVARGADEALGAHFYTRTTELQEELLQRESSGLLVVLGVAGSGKTSVALGRAKVLCDRTKEEGEDEPDFFRPETAVGFVLSAQLSTYLAHAKNALNLHDMPVREYRELRNGMFNNRQIDHGGYTFASLDVEPTRAIEGRMAWLAAADIAVAEEVADRLLSAVEALPGEGDPGRRRAPTARARTPEQREALAGIWHTFTLDIERIVDGLLRDEAARPFRLEALAARIDDARARFATALEASLAWKGADNSESRQNVRSSVRERIVRAIRITDAYASAVASKAFRTTLLGRLGGSDDGAVARASERLAGKRLSETDVDVLLALIHVLSIGYQGRKDRDPISHIDESEYYSQVFIDEFQDFTEVQLFLMGEQADPRRRAITVVGDFCQQLTTGGKRDLATCFPHSSPEERRENLLLENKRQLGRLARLSQRFREVVLGEPPPAEPIAFAETGQIARLLCVKGAEEVESELLSEILRIDREQSLAVVCPSREVAEKLHTALRDELSEQFRESRLSQQADLTRRYYVHFTTALEAKGLEFDAVIVPHLERFDLDNAVHANGSYVAVSRPRASLTLIAVSRMLDERIKRLAQEGLLAVVEAPAAG